MSGDETSAAERLADLLDRQGASGAGEPDGELADLVALARRVATLRPPPLPEADRAAMRLRLTNLAARHATATRPLPLVAPPRRWPFSHPRAVAALASLLLCLALATAAVQASAASLPGEPLYGVKLAREQAAISLAPTGAARANAYADQAADRLAEVGRLAGHADPAQLSALTDEAQRALDRARQSAGGAAAPESPLQQRLRSLEAQRQALSASHGRGAPAQAAAAPTASPPAGPKATVRATAPPLAAAAPASATPTAQPTPTPREPAARAATTSPQPTPTTAPSPAATTVPTPAPSPAASATPSPTATAAPSPTPSAAPTLADVRAPSPRAAVEGFYQALNDALTRDPASFARAYGYLSDAARAQMPYAAFVARYQSDTGVAVRWPSREGASKETDTVVVEVVELRGATRASQLVAWTLVDTTQGWRLDRATVRAAPVPPPTVAAAATATPATGRRQDDKGQQGDQGQREDRRRPACTAQAATGASPTPVACSSPSPGQRGGGGRGPDRASSEGDD